MNSKMLRGPYCDRVIRTPGGADVRCGQGIILGKGKFYRCDACKEIADETAARVHRVGVATITAGAESCPRCKGVSINGVHLVRHACIEDLQKQVTELKEAFVLLAKRLT